MEKNLGLSYIVELYPWDTFYKRCIEKKFQLALAEWGEPTRDLLSMLLTFREKKAYLDILDRETLFTDNNSRDGEFFRKLFAPIDKTCIS